VSFKLVVRPEVDVDLLVAEEWYEHIIEFGRNASEV